MLFFKFYILSEKSRLWLSNLVKFYLLQLQKLENNVVSVFINLEIKKKYFLRL